MQGDNPTSYAFTGTALTSSTWIWDGDFDLATLAKARWRLAWNPQTIAANGVQLIHADDGPTNIVQIAEFTGSTSGTPINSEADVTTTLTSLLGTHKVIGYRVKGNATDAGPLIFLCRLELIWGY